MAELLIRVVDRGKGEEASKAGDVIAICPDGWEWSHIELTHQDWRIVRVPILKSTEDAFLARAQFTIEKRRREWGVDLSLLPDPSLFSGDRKQGVIDLKKAEITSAAIHKLDAEAAPADEIVWP